MIGWKSIVQEIATYLNMLLILIINKQMSRNTKQKTELENDLKRISGFFTAEEFHNHALKRLPYTGIATIYRFLKEKTKKRELHSYMCDKRTVYSNSSNNHCHFICQICGKKQHIDIRDVGRIKRNIKGTICHFQIDVTGVCERCREKS